MSAAPDRTGSPAQTKEIEKAKMHDEIDDILFAAKKPDASTGPGLNRQTTINRLLDVWGGSKKQSSLAGNVGSKAGGGDLGGSKLKMTVQSTDPKEGIGFEKPIFTKIEPTSLDSIFGKNSSSNIDAEPSKASPKRGNTNMITTTTESTSVPVRS